MHLSENLRKGVYLAAFKGYLSKRNYNDSSIDLLLQTIIDKNCLNDKEIKRRKIDDNYDGNYDLPKGWKWVKLGMLADVIRGLTFSTSYKEKSNENILVLRGGNIDSKTEKIIYDDNIYVNKDIPNLNQYLQVGDTLIVASSGTKTSVGKSAYIDNIEDNISFGGFMMVIRPYKEILNAKYLSYNIKIYRDKIINNTIGYISNITNSILNNLLIPLPPIEEQERIVAKVEELLIKIKEFDKIENRLNEIKEKFPTEMRDALLQAAMQGKLSEQLSSDSNVHALLDTIETNKINKIKKKNGISQEEITELFDIPSTWKWTTLNNVLINCTRGKGLSKSDIGTGTTPIILYGQLYTTYTDEIDEVVSFAKYDIANKCSKVNYNDIVIPITSTSPKAEIGKASIFKYNHETYFGSDMISLSHGINSRFLMYLINSPYFNKEKMNFVNGITIKHLNVDSFLSIPIPLPPIEEQERIVEKLDKLLPLCDSLT